MAGYTDILEERLLDENAKDDDRVKAAELLGRRGNGNSAAALVEATRDGNQLVSEAAYSALAVMLLREPKCDEATNALMGGLVSESPHVRKTAAVALGESRNPDAVMSLAGALSREKDLGVALVLLHALGSTGDVRAIDPLSVVLQDARNSEARKEAAWSLARLGQKGVGVDEVIEALHNAQLGEWGGRDLCYSDCNEAGLRNALADKLKLPKSEVERIVKGLWKKLAKHDGCWERFSSGGIRYSVCGEGGSLRFFFEGNESVLREIDRALVTVEDARKNAIAMDIAKLMKSDSPKVYAWAKEVFEGIATHEMERGGNHDDGKGKGKKHAKARIPNGVKA